MSGFFGAAALAAAGQGPRRAKVNTKGQAGAKKESESEEDGEEEEEEQTIRRVFELTHTGYPDAPPRVVTQLQYLEWPDLDVPRDPRGVLQLIREVEEIVERTRDVGERAWGEGPLLAATRRRRSGESLRGGSPSSTSSSSSSPGPLARTGSGETKRGATSLETPSGLVVDDEVDAETGIARHALGNAPVLLHCSAGVVARLLELASRPHLWRVWVVELVGRLHWLAPWRVGGRALRYRR